MFNKSVLPLMVLVTVMGLLSACNAGQLESPVASPTVEAQAQPTIPPKTPTATPVPLTRPSAAKYHLMFDPDKGQVLVIGALRTQTDMWSYDVASQRLTRLPDKPEITVQCLDYHTQARGVVTLSKLSGATWLFNTKKNEWTELAKGLADSDAPSIVGYPCFLSYDSGSDKMVSITNGKPCFTGVYDYSTNTWTENKLDPSPKINAGPMAYDSESDRILMWEALVQKYMWAFDANTNTWERLTYTGGPDDKGGYLAGMVYIPDMDRTFVYYLDQFYAYDYNTNSWEKAKGDLIPGKRILQSLAYDPIAKKIVMYGGMDENATMAFDDLWLYDLQTGEWAKQPIP